MDNLTELFIKFCNKYKLEWRSADEVLSEYLERPDRDQKVVEWLSNFIEMWQVTQDLDIQ